MEVVMALAGVFIPPLAALTVIIMIGNCGYQTNISNPEKAPVIEVQKSIGAWTEAGWYGGGRNLQGCVYKASGMRCAANMPELSKNLRGCWLRITRPGHGQIVCIVNDFGPDRAIFPGRGIDLSPDAADALHMRRCGIAKVFVEVLR